MLACTSTIVCFLAVAACALLPALVLAQQGPMPKTLFTDGINRRAVCNDNTSAGYYFRRGTTDRWMIFLQGGFWCWDVETCAGRWKSSPELMSSNPWPATVNYGGILSQDPELNPTFANANQVYVPYCSSDTFSGEREASAATGGWVFRGKTILEVLVEELAGLGLKDASDIAFVGCSAGAQGVVVNLDFFADQVAKYTDAPVSGIADAGWLMNVQPISQNVPLDTQNQEGIVLWGGIPDASCAAGNKGEEWKCYFSPTAVKYLTTRILIHTEQFDGFQVPWDIGSNPPWNHTQMAYAYRWRALAAATLAQVADPNAVWSGACFFHCIAMGDTYWTVAVNGVTMADAVAKWYAEHDSVHIIDECYGFNCSQHCPVGPFLADEAVPLW